MYTHELDRRTVASRRPWRASEWRRLLKQPTLPAEVSAVLAGVLFD
jgi:hypothetical protein